MLKRGGSAVDAGIAAAFTLGVVAPDCSGIGGGGFALVWDPSAQSATALDFREAAPAGLKPAEFEAHVHDDSPRFRGMRVGVPGEVAGLFELHRRYGRLSIQEDMAPAIEAAELGYATGPALARNAYAFRSEILTSPLLRELFEPPETGPVFVGYHLFRHRLAQTLRSIATEGPRALYDGPIADGIIAAVTASGGWLTKDDLRRYRPIERVPLATRWDGYDVLTMPPPSAGGLLLSETLRELTVERLRALGYGTPDYVHVLSEAFRGAMADRILHIGDPAFVSNPVQELLSVSRLDRRASNFDETHALPSSRVEEHGTSHLVVVDGSGQIVSLTTTVGDAFGARVAVESSGVILNDELSDFTTSDQFAPFRSSSRTSNPPNAPRPTARPVSSMTPVIVLQQGVPVLAAGGAGGLRIATGVTQALLATLAFDRTPLEAVSAPRFHTPYERYTVELEYGSEPGLASELRARGERVDVTSNFSAVQVIRIRERHGAYQLDAAADPRFAGSAVVR